jgi:hypothetical protein
MATDKHQICCNELTFLNEMVARVEVTLLIIACRFHGTYFGCKWKEGLSVIQQELLAVELWCFLHAVESCWLIGITLNSIRIAHRTVVGTVTGQRSGRPSNRGCIPESFVFFRVSRPAVWPTQPPMRWVPGALSPGRQSGRGVNLIAHLLPVGLPS